MAKDDTKVKALEGEVESLNDRLKRLVADYQNLEKRVDLEKAEFVKFANAQLILKILLALDSLQMAADHLQDQGLNLALKQLEGALVSEGLEKIDTKGRRFDPEIMECVEVVKGEEGKVLDETQSGYKLNSRVLRVAKVRVGKNEEIDKKI